MPDAVPVLDHHDLILRPDPSRTVVRPFQLEYPGRFKLADHSRAQAIGDRVMTLDEARLDCELKLIVESLDERHRDVDAMLLRRFAQVCPTREGKVPEDNDRRRLVGAYFSEEFSFEAAALFYPSAVMAPDQSHAPEGGCSFILSLRGIGEGHVSSVTFRTGHWVPGGDICVDTPRETAVPPRIDGEDVERDKTVELRCDASRDISDTLLDWSGGGKVVSPCYPWEFVQMGNCGSPIEIDEGWLVFTHGVGTVRNYCMGACLLDKGDPSKLLARTPQPILAPSADERDGYVPNVVYSCGARLHGRDVMIPFGVADNFAAFATTTVDRLLAVME